MSIFMKESTEEKGKSTRNNKADTEEAVETPQAQEQVIKTRNLKPLKSRSDKRELRENRKEIKNYLD